MRRMLPSTWGLVLLGVLAIAAGLIFLGDRGSRSFPSATSYSPSGASAAYELFKRLGYRPEIDASSTPTLRKGDLVVAFSVVSDPEDALEAFIDAEGDEENPSMRARRRFRETVRAHIEAGGSALFLPLSSDFRALSKRMLASPKEAQSFGGTKARINATGDGPGDSFLDLPQEGIKSLWSLGGNPFAERHTLGKGSAVVLADGAIATNRFLDRERNAEVLMDVVAKIAQPGARVVFTEASFGNAREQGLLSAIGPWAQAAWWQIVFIFAVLVYALGKPFGLPETVRRTERGARELLDAVAFSFQRGRMTSIAMDSAKDEAERLLLRWSRTPTEQLDGTPRAVAFANLKMSLARLEAAKDLKPTEREAFDLIKDLERKTRELADVGGRSHRTG